MDIVANLNRIVNESGLRKNFIAKKMNITPGLLSNLLAGKRIMRTEHVIGFANVLGVTPNEIYGIEKNENTEDNIN